MIDYSLYKSYFFKHDQTYKYEKSQFGFLRPEHYNSLAGNCSLVYVIYIS